MPQDGSGNYQYPLGTRGVPDETIESAAYNNFLDDLVDHDLNFPRPLHRGGTGATTADAALVTLGAEKAAQLVTNYDTQVWFPGSFRSASTATAGPVDGHAFAGIVYINEPLASPPTNANVTVSARDMNDTVVPSRVYVREKKAGVWGAWVIGDASDKVSKSGGADGIMTGFLTLNADPTAVLHATTKQYVDGAIALALAGTLPATELQFVRASSQYMTRAFGSTSSLPWTLSMWVKRNSLATHQALFGVEIPANKLHIAFMGAGNQIGLMGGASGATILAIGSVAFSNINTWLNIVFSSSTAAAAPVTKGFNVNINNGVDAFSASTSDPGLNTTAAHYIGQPAGYPDLYMKEVVFVDGSVVPPTTFGINSGGVWMPKLYTGPYGPNGFKLTFSNQLSPANLGKDSSPNGNHWTAFNF